MALLNIAGHSLSEIKEAPFKLEKEIQRLTEANLGILFGLEFVSSEFERDGLRIDTLAFDQDVHFFVIVEYKRDQSFSVVDQGFAYLALMLNHKEAFLVEYNEKRNKSLKLKDIDWSQSRVVFVSKSFTNYQQAASGFKDLPIELWKVTRYASDLIHYDRVETRKTAAAITALRSGNAAEQVAKQVKIYTETDIIPTRGKAKVLYEELRDRVLKLDNDLHTHVTKAYISFRQQENWRNIFTVIFRSNKLRIELLRTKPSEVKDPEGKVKYIEGSMKYYNQHISYLEASTDKELEYGLYIIQQVLERFRASQEKH